MVIRANGERDFLLHEPLEGWAAWTKNLDATVVEYILDAMIYPPPKKEKTGP